MKQWRGIRVWALGWAQLWVAMMAGWCSGAFGGTVLIEAESFGERGGWVVDPQFMDQMGSPYLLAHGLGKPVGDAVAQVSLPEAGSYRVLVRTMDWVARWKALGEPGRFQVVLGGRPLGAVFGTEGADWHWQEGGRFESGGGQVEVRLRDLTGIEGRCDAILLTTDADLLPPNRDPEMAAFRRRVLGQPDAPVAAGEYDLVVTGGGIAGTCCAVTAARLGLAVALVQDRPVLGGNNSSEVRVWLQGARNKEPWPRVGDVVAELEQARRAHYGPENNADLYEDEKKLAVARGEPNLRLFLEHRANGVEMDGKRIRAVVAQPILGGPRVRLVGRWFADCTGDGALGFLAGADSEMTAGGRLGSCNLWNVIDRGTPMAFPRCPWALDLSARPFPGRHKTDPDIKKLGGWYWESGFDRDPFGEMEYIRDWNFRAMYGAWDAIKNVDGALATWALDWSAHIMGKRESRRLMGDVVLQLQDLVQGREFPDGCAPTGWKVDLHLPDPHYEAGFEGDAFISEASFGRYKMPYWIPYRCLYSRNVPNLFMAGRCISVTHDALGAVRVMRTGGCMGEIVGMAASLCRKHGCDPRAVYASRLADLHGLMRQGVGRGSAGNLPYENQGEDRGKKQAGQAVRAAAPIWLADAGVNIAPWAKVHVSGSRDVPGSPPTLLNDGRADTGSNAGRWLSDKGEKHWVEFEWSERQRIGAIRVISGYRDARGHMVASVPGIRLLAEESGQWRDVPGASVSDNGLADWSARFEPVSVTKVRLELEGMQDGIARVWEVELYPGADAGRR
ncbi:MAG TPA: FAD-dependent oxidoreductase [Verrucomicrobiae bacterium]|nr:FAD-dependent oxidoreductase [Verrucomicrobiae bacterium]